ncbi:hypothetical protein OAM80_00505 [Gammaproteobacteria bacterium]|nr:hypothetical protein [Gammaproteobacteria bacterium]|tara:strand:- start:365 stop:1513 length:1149 start_codon:yes stop_codon:yes gene_type:complete
MSQYIAHILNSNADSINVYEITNAKSSVFNISSFTDLNILNETDSLIVLIPSSRVTSYEFEENKSLSKQINIANFVSEVDSVFADPVSTNDYFIQNNAAYVVDKMFLQDLNTSLSELNTHIYVLPEYLINAVKGEDVITEFEDRFMISHSNKTGFALNHNSLDQYLEIVLNKNPNFNPVVFSTNKKLVNRFNEKATNKSLDLSSIKLSEVIKLPNFFRLQISLSLLIKKMNLSKTQFILSLLALLIVIAGPRYLINENNTNARLYSSSTFNIFKAIDKNVNRVVDPRSQIDQILKQLPESNFSSVKLPNLDVFLKYGSKYISDISLDANTSIASIRINSMPDFQFNILKNNAERFNINIIDDDLITNDGLINGILKVGYSNE